MNETAAVELEGTTEEECIGIERGAWLSSLQQICPELGLERWILERCNWPRSANSEQLHTHTHVARGVSEDFN